MMSTEKEEQIPLIQKDIPESSGFTWYLGLAAIICVVGSSFQVGYNNALTNSPQEVLKLFINESYQTNYNETISEELLTTFWAITSSAIGIGGMIGSLV
ncbi:hypothetical protein SNE40_011346 [Patella caerulea]|uniref:Uncharacterized protein n=1 Tax=Patella caerulea TaxID=87958 RepID=A0AAN8PTW4_PATCE